MNPIFGAIFVACLFMAQAGAQETPEAKHQREYVEARARAYGLANLNTPYRSTGQPEIADLKGLRSFLETRFKEGYPLQYGKGNRLFLSFSFIDPIRDNKDVRVFYTGEVRAWLKPSFDDAPRTAASYLSNLAVIFDRGTPSGATLGDWSVHLAQRDRDEAVFFLRKNVFIAVYWNGPTTKDKPRPGTNTSTSEHRDEDSTVHNRCEQLARQIDELLNRPEAPRAE